MLAVIVPSYNDVKYIKQMIEMAIRIQEKYDFQFYFIDDKSTDSTYEVLSKYKNVLNVHSNAKNSGPGYTRQVGLEIAVEDKKNTHFAFLDCGDFYYMDSVQIMSENIKKYPNSVMHYGWSIKSKLNLNRNNITIKTIDIKIRKTVPLIFSPLMTIYTIPRKYIHDFKFKYRINYIYEDGIITHTFLFKYYKEILSCNIPIFHYTQEYTSITRSLFNKNLDDIYIALDDLIIRNRNIVDNRSIAYTCIRELLAHIYYAYENYNYITSKEVKKAFAFLKTNFTYSDIEFVQKHLNIKYKLFFILCKYNIKWCYILILFSWKLSLKSRRRIWKLNISNILSEKIE